MNKFNIGDEIIGNELASRKYSITKEGTIWTVSHIYLSGSIRVSHDRDSFVVDPDAFDLLRPADVPSICEDEWNTIMVE